MIAARLIVDPPSRGSWNMAVDQALLHSANQVEAITFRLYRWSPATLSLGYFQRWEDRHQHPPSSQCPWVRRASGGGAIVHDLEWTYSITIPARQRLSRQHADLVEQMHGVWVELLAEHGIQTELYRPAEGAQANGTDPFLCFQRRATHDLVLGQYKIGGSAQRRVEGAILQHGSLLLQKSACAPELPGLLDLAPQATDKFADQFAEKWVYRTARRWGLDWQRGGLTPAERQMAQMCESDRFAHSDWNRRR